MSKKCFLVDVSTHVTDFQLSFDWGICVLCQQQTREGLVDPSKSFPGDTEDRYQTLVDSLLKFDAIGLLPQHLQQVVRPFLDSCAGLFRSNHAKWHK